MISVKYQLFLIDTKAEKKDQLIAVDPAFSAPSAIDSILKTTKFEDLKSLTIVGLEENIDGILKQAERKDSTDWLDFDWEERFSALKDLAEEHGLQVYEKLREPESEQKVYGEEITAKGKVPYPPDLPHGNREIWDAVSKQEDYKIGWKILKASGKATDPNIVMAVHRNFYERYIVKLNKGAPFHNFKKQDISEKRITLKGFIVQGEEKISLIFRKISDDLLHAGLIHKERARKSPCISRSTESNHYLMTWQLPWVLKPEAGQSWLKIATFLKQELGKNYGFKENRNRLTTSITVGTVTTLLDIVKQDDKTIVVYIHHQLTEDQARTLTSEVEHNKVEKKLVEYCNHWKKTGKFPKIEKEDLD